MTSQTIFLLGAKVNNAVAKIKSNILRLLNLKKKIDLKSNPLNNILKCYF